MSNELVKQISYILYSEPEENVKINAVIKDEKSLFTILMQLYQSAIGLILQRQQNLEFGQLEF